MNQKVNQVAYDKSEMRPMSELPKESCAIMVVVETMKIAYVDAKTETLMTTEDCLEFKGWYPIGGEAARIAVDDSPNLMELLTALEGLERVAALEEKFRARRSREAAKEPKGKDGTTKA